MSMCNTCKNPTHLARDCEWAPGSCTCQHRTENQVFYDMIQADGGTPVIIGTLEDETQKVWHGGAPEVDMEGKVHLTWDMPNDPIIGNYRIEQGVSMGFAEPPLPPTIIPGKKHWWRRNGR